MMRVTELQSVIAELTRKYNEATGNIIAEEEEEDAASQSSSDLEAEEGRKPIFLIYTGVSQKVTESQFEVIHERFCLQNHF